MTPRIGNDRTGTRDTSSRPSPLARDAARRAAALVPDATALLAALVAFPTVAAPPTPNVRLAPFRALKAYLAEVSRALGLDCADHGAAVVIGLGNAPDRLGLLTHGDVQPADPERWRGDPFVLDATSVPGRLVGRGVEDDKASIATALCALRTVRALGVALRRRIELIVSMTEESDWTPFREFVRAWDPPAINVALDAKYPVVTAEKGSGGIFLTVAPDAPPDRPPTPASHMVRPHKDHEAEAPARRRDRAGNGPAIAPHRDHEAGASAQAPCGGTSARRPRIVSFTGGEARTRVPAAAVAVIEHAGADLEAALGADSTSAGGVTFDVERDGDRLTVRAHGVAAHSSTPWEGRNAITHLAARLAGGDWAPTPASRMVRLLDDLVGAGDCAERFGGLAHTHPFMGPLTLAATRLHATGAGDIEACLNVRSPVGRDRAQVETAARAAIEAWTVRRGGNDRAAGWRWASRTTRHRRPTCRRSSTSTATSPASPTPVRSPSAAARRRGCCRTGSTSARRCPALPTPDTATTSS